MRIRRLNHSVYQIAYHIVWGTKYRRKILKHYVRRELIKSLYQVQKDFPDWYFDKINTGDDHVHMLMEIPPTYTIVEVIQKLKGHSSKHLRKSFKFINDMYTESGIWSTGYFVSTVGLNEEQIRKYIKLQNKYDQSEDLQAEFS